VRFRGPDADVPLSADIDLSRSLSQGLEALSCFTGERPQLDLEELAEELRCSTANTRLYVSTLLRMGYLQQDEDGRYSIGVAGVNVGRAFLEALPIRRLSQPLLKALRDLTGHTVSLAVLDGTEVIYISTVHGHSQGQYDADLNQRAGTQVKLQHSSAGRVLLAYLPKARRHAVCADLDFVGAGRAHSEALSALHCELDRIRADGLAAIGQHPIEGARTIAGAVRDHTNTVVAAIELTAPASRYSGEQIVSQLGPALAQTCRLLSESLH
jgi:IclR family pca regulon transcriptional regulator